MYRLLERGEQKQKSEWTNETYTVIPRLTKVIRSGINFVSRNFSLSQT